MKNKILYGISYGSAIKSFENIEEVLNYNIDILEVPLCDDNEMEKIKGFAIENKLKLGLHIPSHFLVQKHPFILNFTSHKEVDIYINSVVCFLKVYSGFEYVVAHLPIHSNKENETRLVLNNYFIKKLKETTERFNITLLIENVAIYNSLYKPEDYAKHLDNCGLCFDIGHAHTMSLNVSNIEDKNYVKEFFFKLRSKITSVHLYNSTIFAEKYSPKRHYPFIPNKYFPSDGFMNYEKIKVDILSLPNLKYIIFEPHRQEYLSDGQIGIL